HSRGVRRATQRRFFSADFQVPLNEPAVGSEVIPDSTIWTGPSWTESGRNTVRNTKRRGEKDSLHHHLPHNGPESSSPRRRCQDHRTRDQRCQTVFQSLCEVCRDSDLRAGPNMAAVRAAVCLCMLLLPAVAGLQSEDRECAFTDHLMGAVSHNSPTSELRGVVRENGTVRCSRGSRCYGLWVKRPDGEIHLLKQGCWTHIGDQQECHGDHCLVTPTPFQIQNG
uniref:uncharacterized protein LOC109970432 n=1 Tax=Monopterus albus TaxID=43700 RepID=UPI0009B38BF9